MGATEFNCKHCGGRTDDCNGGETFEIAGYKSYATCPSCTEKVSKMLVLEKSLGYKCFIDEKNTRQRVAFDTLSLLREWLGDKDSSKYEFGMYKDSYWGGVEKEAFLGKGTCGGMSKQDIRKAMVPFIKRVEESNGKYEMQVEVGWRGHRIDIGSRPAVLVFFVCSPDDLVKQMEIYERNNHLEGTPHLVTAEGGLLPNAPKELENFCFPDKNKKLKWFATIGELEEAFMDPKEMNRCGNGAWKLKQEFLDHHFKDIERKAAKLQRKRKTFEDLQEEFNKRAKT